VTADDLILHWSKFKPSFAAKRTTQRRNGGDKPCGEMRGNQSMTSADGTPVQIEAPDLVNNVGGGDGPDHTPDQGAPAREALQRGDAHLRPVEDLHSLLLRISHHLDFETSERTTIYYRLRAIDEQMRKIMKQTRRRHLRAFARTLTAVLIGVAATLAWQSYGDQAKQTIATGAPALGWSPESKQMIAGFIERLGWTKQAADTAPVQATALQTAQAAPAAPALASSAPPAPAVDPEQVQQIVLSLGALRQSLDQIASGQDQMAREIARLQSADTEILEKIPAPPRAPAVAPARKPISVAPAAPSRAPVPAR
jgi:hypothetical protein